MFSIFGESAEYRGICCLCLWVSTLEPNLSTSLKPCLIASNLSCVFKSFAETGPLCFNFWLGGHCASSRQRMSILWVLTAVFQHFQVCSLVHVLMSHCQIAVLSRISTACFKYLDWENYRKWSANGMKQMYSSYRNHSLHETSKHRPLPTIWFTFFQLHHNICCKESCRVGWENMLNTNIAEQRIKPFQT